MLVRLPRKVFIIIFHSFQFCPARFGLHGTLV